MHNNDLLAPHSPLAWQQLSRPLRLAIAAPWCLLAAAVCLGLAGGVEVRLDATHKPMVDVSLASAHWIDTLDAARLPASVPLLDGAGMLSVHGNLAAQGLIISGGTFIDPAGNYYDANGDNVIDTYGAFYYNNGSALTDGSGNLYYSSRGTLADADGYLYYGDGNYLADASGTLFYSGQTPLADSNGYLYYSTGNILADSEGYLYYVNGNYLTDGGGDLYSSGGDIIADPNGNLYANAALTINTPGGGIAITDPDSNPYLITVSTAGTLVVTPQ